MSFSPRNNNPPSTRVQPLVEQLKKRILVLDGAMGTAIQDLSLVAKDFGGDAYEGCNENLVLTQPAIIQKIHEDYLKAGADIIETNTFGATALVLGEFSLSQRAYEINFEAAKLALKAVSAVQTVSRPRFVAGSIGPTTKAISVTGGIEFEALINEFYHQAKALWEGGVHYLLLETCQDTRNIKAALLGIDRLSDEMHERIPVAISGTIEPMGTMLAGQGVDALLASVNHVNLIYLGLNCATGPDFMTDHIRSLSALSRFPVACVPNAGLPDENGIYLESPSMMVNVLGRFITEGWVNLLGGCCGTTARHIKAFAELAENKAPRKLVTETRSMLSGAEYLEVVDEIRPVIVGERTNVIGSKKFKKLIQDGDYEPAAEIGKRQVKRGAQILDVCLANPDRDEFEDISRFLSFLVQKVKVPLMIDSTDAVVIEKALTYCQGKSLINSINLEDGEERFEAVVPIANRFGAALVVGTIDEDPVQGMGVKRERKLEIATRSYELLTEKYGVLPEDIYWDPLVFPCGTGDVQYQGSAVETIEGIRLIKAKFPRTKTVLGISNVSFGLPTAGREVLNSVFLYHCVQAGLDLAIVSSEKLVRFSSISEAEIKLSDDLLFDRHPEALQAFAAFFREAKLKAVEGAPELSLMDRLANYIVEGSKDGLQADLTEALTSLKPLQIINGPLMKGMDTVGKLFNENKLIVAEVLQSAEAMKAAVSFLEPFMEKSETAARGKILLATVKGDVHDIGKNLVEIILSNNGFNVINLGIKVPPEKLIEAISEHKPDIVGLSGLLVKSAQQMVVTAEDFSRRGISTPILVGGAALSRNFVNRQIAKAYGDGTVAYAQDAMSGLELAKTIVDPQKLQSLKNDLASERRNMAPTAGVDSGIKNQPVSEKRSESVVAVSEIPKPPDYDRHSQVNQPDITEVWKFINPMMLYGRHLGVKGNLVRLLTEANLTSGIREKVASEDPKALKIWEQVEEVKRKYVGSDFLNLSMVWKFFGAVAQGNQIHLFDGPSDSGKPVHRFQFPRQVKDSALCLSDYVSLEPGARDNVAMFAVTVGKGIREQAELLKNRGDYLESHILQALVLESAEALAEWLHADIRKKWGFADPVGITMLERFQARYHGKRFSFGYPACPELQDQKGLFELLQPETIGIELTDGFMMDPEASVSAIVFHHPQAQYFSVGQGGGMNG